MDVTTEVNRSISSMGGSGSGNPAYYAASKSLNYAKSKNSLVNAAVEKVTAIPYTLSYKDSVGLFGAENVFVKVQLNIQSARSAFTNIQTPENDYMPVWTFPETDTVNFYETGEFDFLQDFTVVNSFDPSTITNDLTAYQIPYVRVDLANLRTGNKYIDSWFDVRIYTKDRKEHEYDTIYMGINDYFYLGFHARNTRRLPYNVEVTIGDEYLEFYDLTDAQRRMAA